MNEALKVVLSLSLSGSLLILLLLLLRPLFKGRLSKRWQYYIWLVVVARLLLPFAPETNLMGALFQEIDKGMEQMELTPPPTQLGDASAPLDGLVPGDEAGGQDSPKSEAQEAMGSADNPARSLVTVLWKNLWLSWLVVALILFIRKITIYQSFVKYIRAGCVEVADIERLERFGTLVEQSRVKGAVELCANSLISSPLLIGFFRPCIVLPSADLSPADFEYTILHELTHYKRLDMFYKWLVQFAVCVHWFNPLVYLMGREAGRACELSCDEAVIRKLDLRGRRAYGDTLLNTIGMGGAYKSSLASVTLSENAELLKERLDAIMKSSKSGKFVAILSVLLAIFIFTGGFALGAYSAKPDWEGTTPGQMTGEGLPVMSAKNRNLYETYVAPISVTGLLYRNFSPEDVSSLLTENGSTLMFVLDALRQEQIQEFDGAIPAKFVEEELLAVLPLQIWNIKDACASIYDEATDTYAYNSGLGGGPAIPIVMESRQDGKIITLRYTWYLGDPAADTFRYIPGNSGELMIEISNDRCKYISNKITVTAGQSTD